MDKKPKKKIIGKKLTAKPGEVVQQGEPTKVTMEATRGERKQTYTPTSAETGKKEYGKPGGGTDKEMNALLKEAREKKQDVTKFSSKGLTYKAGETKVEEKPATFKTSIDVKPTIRKIDLQETPIYEKAKKPDQGKLKPMDLTFGGSDRKGNPANKYGMGKSKKVVIRKVKSFPKG